MKDISIYQDIISRTDGEIYLGVVGPVRTGKSTFVRRFIEEFFIDKLDGAMKEELLDEIPVSGIGSQITTTEPKFIPKKAVEINIAKDINKKIKLRVIDCVGYMVRGATGDMVDGRPRMVKTPWSDELIPLPEAARIGTQKVIHNHSTLCLMITTDGSVTEIEREGYLEAERQSVSELKNSDKPFVIILNTNKPYSKEVKELADNMSEEYGTCVIPMNVEQLSKNDIDIIFDNLLHNFPVSEINFNIPEYCYLLEDNSSLKEELMKVCRDICSNIKCMGDVNSVDNLDSDDILGVTLKDSGLSTGKVWYDIKTSRKSFYDIISSSTGMNIENETEYVLAVKNLINEAAGYKQIKKALLECNESGYGVLYPDINEVLVDKPGLITKSGKYGVKINAYAPCMHIIKTDINTQIEPIIGNEHQARDLYDFINDTTDRKMLLDTNIFGKTLGELITDEINSKLNSLDEEAKNKIKNSLVKIVNESSNLVCFII